MSLPAAAKQRAESQFIIQWKVANAPKIRRRRRTKRQIEEDRLKALQEANEKQDTSQSGTSTAASATKARILPKPAAAQEDATPRPPHAEQASARLPHTPITPPHPASISDSSSSPFHFGLHSDSLSQGSNPAPSHSSPPLPHCGTSSSYDTRPAGEDSILDLLHFQKTVFDRSFPPERPSHQRWCSTSLSPDLVSSDLLGFFYHPVARGSGEALDARAPQRPAAIAPPPDYLAAWSTSTTTTTSSTSAPHPPPSSTRRKRRGYEAAYVTARQLQHQIATRRGATEEECAELAKGSRCSHAGKKKEPSAMEQAAAALYAAHQVTSSRMVSNDAPLYSLQNVRKLMQVFQRYVMTMILPAPTCTSACVHRLTLNPHTHTHHCTRTHGSFAVQMLLGVHTHAPLGDVRHELAAPAGHRRRVGRQGRLAPAKRQHRPGSRCVVDIEPTQRERRSARHSLWRATRQLQGAHLLGATRVAEQYFERARAHLASLFDTNSYMVAEAMFSMGYYLYAQVRATNCSGSSAVAAPLTCFFFFFSCSAGQIRPVFVLRVSGDERVQAIAGHRLDALRVRICPTRTRTCL